MSKVEFHGIALWMRAIKVVLLWTLFIALLLFALSNNQHVAITFVGARIAEAPLSLVIFATSSLGILIGVLIGWFIKPGAKPKHHSQNPPLTRNP